MLLEFQREGPRKAQLMPRWMVEEQFSTLRKFEKSGDVGDNKPRGFTPMGVAAIESFKGRSKGKGKGKSSVSEDTRTEIARMDWWDAHGDSWNDRRDNWREGQWRQDREWHGDSRERERSGHRRWDDNSWDV